MKKLNVLIKIAFVLFLFSFPLIVTGCYTTGSPGNTSSQSNNINTAGRNDYNLDELNNNGEWITISNYGNVWRPHVVDGWMPFDNGHWTYANGNWTWISYEPFGWIVYHYGNWYDDPFYGWVWVPSDAPWSPARVIWADYDDYIGWAPLPPRGVVYGNPWGVNEDRHWHVVRHKDFAEDNVRNYRVNNIIRNETATRSTTNSTPGSGEVRNNRGNDPVRNQTATRSLVNRAPVKTEIERSAGKPITEVKIQQESVKLPKKEISRMNLPPQEIKRVEQNSPRVKKEVLVPRDEFQKKQSKTKEEPKKSTDNK